MHIHLQGIGQFTAKQAGELEIGEVMVWNYGFRSEIIDIVPRGQKMITITERSLSNGETYTRNFKKSRAVAFEAA